MCQTNGAYVSTKYDKNMSAINENIKNIQGLSLSSHYISIEKSLIIKYFLYVSVCVYDAKNI